MTELRDDLVRRPVAATPDPVATRSPRGSAGSSEDRGRGPSVNGGAAEAAGDEDRRRAPRGRVHSLDDRVDAWFEPWRGRPGLDGAAKVVTGLGDHGFLWAAITAWRGRRPGPGRSQAVRALAVAGIESRLVNSALKRTIGRRRPDRTGLNVTSGGVPVREPTSSSFPSGHTLAAFCAATAMCRRGDRAGNVLLMASATLVGLSRLHLRAHHASDVLGGAVIGTALGLLGRRFL